MFQLINQTSGKVLAANLKKAETLRERMQGLIGKEQLKETEALWISYCTSIHTFFMTYPIDVVFTDKNFQVVSLFEGLCSGKVVWGGWNSRNVFEMKEGQIKKLYVKKGDILYVEH